MSKKLKVIREFTDTGGKSSMPKSQPDINVERREKAQRDRISAKSATGTTNKHNNYVNSSKPEPNRGPDAARHPSVPKAYKTGPNESVENIEESPKSERLMRKLIPGYGKHVAKDLARKMHYKAGIEDMHANITKDPEMIRKYKVAQKTANKLDKIAEARESEYRSNIALSTSKKAPGHYLVKNGVSLNKTPHATAQHALTAWNNLSNREGVKIHHVKEEVEEINELSKKTLGSYIKKASDDVSYHSFNAGQQSTAGNKKDSLESDKTSFKRLAGVKKAAQKLAKEETINEIGDTLRGRMKLRSYIKKSKDSEEDMKVADALTGYKHHGAADKHIEKKIIGQGRAMVRLRKEETVSEAIGDKRFDVVTQTGQSTEYLSHDAAKAAVKGLRLRGIKSKMLRKTIKEDKDCPQVGKHNKVPEDVFDPKELAMGIKIEHEHTNDPVTAEKIAKDHLSEFPDYYSRLTKLEKKAKEHVAEETVDEVLTPSMGSDTYVHDFVHSKNPKFAGKSKKERIKMALGAYYGAKRNEEVEIDESISGKSPWGRSNATKPEKVPKTSSSDTPAQKKKKAHNYFYPKRNDARYESVDLEEAKGKLNYTPVHSSYYVAPPGRRNFLIPYALNKAKEAHEHAAKIGGTVMKMDQMGRSMKEEFAMAVGGGDPAHVTNPTDNYSAQKKRLGDIKTKMVRRKKPVG
jgi:hypothetical protein